MEAPSSIWLSLRKLMRFAIIYGPSRAFTKALGRLRIGFSLPSRPRGMGVGLIGCGQFAFSTIAHFLRGHARLRACYDLNSAVAVSFAKAYKVGRVAAHAADLITDPDIDIVYIASNHASHAAYAVSALVAEKRVYIEKPVAVTLQQLVSLRRAVDGSTGRLFAGYNRPFSAAVRDLRANLPVPRGPLTLSCFVSGHRIPTEHWYRNPEEGTRICGNVGHWLDLAVHLLLWRELPDRWTISLLWSNPEARDDDLSISLASEHGDLVSIVLTARSEPFEGINETINLQWDGVIAKIDDFRSMTVWQEEKLKKFRYWPKDVGHKRAVLQPFGKEYRAWSEVELSSLLMLKVAEMVLSGCTLSEFSFSSAKAALDEISP